MQEGAAGSAVVEVVLCIDHQKRYFVMQVDANDEYPVHQADEKVKLEVQHLLAWLGCALQHKTAGMLGS